MNDSATFLDRALALADADAAFALYADWAPAYEREMAALRYAAPARCVEALLDCGANLAAPVLDLGCGTGLAGAALRDAGFHVVDGSDFSPEMLAVARERAGTYRDLDLGDLRRPIPAQPGEYATFTMVGVLEAGHAPPHAVEDALMRLAPGGLLALTLSDRARADAGYEARVAQACESGTAEALFNEPGPYLPGAGLRANVIVLRRL